MDYIEDHIAKAAESTGGEELRSGTWSVFAEYKRDAKEGYIKAPPKFFRNKKFIDNERWDYQPMVRYPDLFLRFARLFDDVDDEYETDRNATVALDWAHDYGVLGLTPSKTPGAYWGEVRGGPDDSVRAFSLEASLANRTLRLYELATDPQGLDIEAIKNLMPSMERVIYGNRSPNVVRGWALHEVAVAVAEQIARHAYPSFYQTTRGDYVRAWAFHNLLGAMWLQMYFLLTSTDQARCANVECNKVIAIEEPVQAANVGSQKNARGKYRTRADKKFCSKECANRHHYLRTKERRQTG